LTAPTILTRHQHTDNLTAQMQLCSCCISEHPNILGFIRRQQVSWEPTQN